MNASFLKLQETLRALLKESQELTGKKEMRLAALEAEVQSLKNQMIY